MSSGSKSTTTQLSSTLMISRSPLISSSSNMGRTLTATKMLSQLLCIKEMSCLSITQFGDFHFGSRSSTNELYFSRFIAIKFYHPILRASSLVSLIHLELLIAAGIDLCRFQTCSFDSFRPAYGQIFLEKSQSPCFYAS